MSSRILTNFLKFTLLLTLLLVFSPNGQSQELRFGATAVVGLTAAQLNGDANAGYNKLGPTAGLRGTVELSDRWTLAMEITFAQRGSRYPTGLNNPTPGFPLNITTSYVDIPVVISIGDWLSEDETYYRVHLRGGLAYGRLFNVVARDSPYDNNLDLFSDNDFYFLIGASYNINSKIALAFRYNRSLTLLYNNAKNSSFNANSLFSHFLSMRVEYQF